ncbi:CRISPR-associated endonuclease Cas2 [Thermovibrio ammonificans]|nr:CRISPR-associated endonuclease Cas2 [Thermovibrio ammonificans]
MDWKEELGRLTRRKFFYFLRDTLEMEIKSGKFSKYLLVYDISDNLIRIKFSDILEEFSERVQLSAFEVPASPNVIARIAVLAMQFAEIDDNLKVYLYPIDKGSEKKIIRIGSSYLSFRDIL